MLCKVAYCTGRVLANTRLHQLCWGAREMGTAISCRHTPLDLTYVKDVAKVSSAINKLKLLEALPGRVH